MVDSISVEQLPGLVTAWDFSEPAGGPRAGRGPRPAVLRECGGPIERVPGGVWSDWSARFTPGAWLEATHAAAPQLDLRDAVTLLAWIWREPKEGGQCQAVAGKWLETDARRQYCLFLDLRIHDSRDQAALHVSRIGGPTPGERWCMDAAIGQTPLPMGRWQCVVGTFAHGEARVYVDGVLDARAGRNPYAYAGPLFASGADFTVGAVHRLGEIGNWFTGRLGGLAVCDRAWTAEEAAFWSKQAAWDRR